MALCFLDLEELEKIRDHPSVFCLAIRTNLISKLTRERLSTTTIHFYSTAKSRQNGLRHWRREYKLWDVVFFSFEIPIDLFLNTAEKLI